MKTRELVKLSDAAYSALRFLNDIKLTQYRDKLAAMAESEERDHRRGAPNGTVYPRGATVAAAGRLFAVKRIAEALRPDKHRAMTLADVLHVQPSAVYAAAIAANYGEDIKRAWKALDVGALAELDYCDLVYDGKENM